MKKADAEDLKEEAKANREGFSRTAGEAPARDSPPSPILLEGLPPPRGQLRPARKRGKR
jgi:hypothetical protein